MSRLARILAVLMVGAPLLTAQIPNPLNLPDPLGLSKKPAPAPAPRREGGRVERRPGRDHRDHGKHKGQEKRERRESGGHKGSGRR